MDNAQHYIGSELDLFAQANHWKRYLQKQLGKFVRGDVLEVGAGIGGTTRVLQTGNERHWTCLEPDADLASQIVPEIAAHSPRCADALTVVVGTIPDLPPSARYDTILYIDVLEHIEDHELELQRAASLLTSRGHLIVLSPAHQWLFSPFDQAIGHYRRYTRRTLRALTPPGVTLVRLRYLDCVGLLASLANRCLLRSEMPTKGQIKFWDSVMVPCSRIADPLTAYRLGKSVVAVWRDVRSD